MIGEVKPLEADIYQRINGEDTLDFEATVVLSDGDRIVWDDLGQWREHVINEVDQRHFGAETFSYSCESSLIWDWGHKQIRYAKWDNVTAQFVVNELSKLVPGWNPGECDDLGKASFEFSRISVYDALMQAVGEFDAEVDNFIEVDKLGVTSRTAMIKKQIGKDSGARFDYAHGIDGIEKQIQQQYFYTAAYGYGKSSGSGANSMLWVYVVNDEAAKKWGVSDGQGGISHLEGSYSNSECDNLKQLEQETIDWLNSHCEPPITYTVDIPDAALYGVRIGDKLQVTDKEYTPPLRIEPRMAEMSRNLITQKTTSAVFGTVISLVPDAFTRSYDASKNAQAAAERAEAAAGSVSAKSIMQDMGTIYEEGGSYVVLTPSGGIITASVPLDAEGNPIEIQEGMQATRLSNGRIYYSNRVENGRWVWVETNFTEAI